MPSGTDAEVRRGLRSRYGSARHTLAVAARLRLARFLPSALHHRPGFLVIGAQRSGTTSLYHYLCEHPTVLRSAIKEIHYFDLQFDRSLWWYGTFFPSHVSPSARRGQGTCIAGESSPYYMFHPHVPRRVAETLPDVRLIAVLRNPAARALSHYQHEVQAGREWLSFEEAVAAEDDRIGDEVRRMELEPGYVSAAHQRFSYVSRGRYAEQLERWLELFPREQLLVASAEQLYADPDPVIRSVHRFLGLEERAVLDTRAFNASRVPSANRPSLVDLVEYYRPHNRRLFDLLGTEFDWPA